MDRLSSKERRAAAKGKDKRLPIFLSSETAKGSVIAWKTTLEEIHGKDLEWNEVVELLGAYVDLTPKRFADQAYRDVVTIAAGFRKKGEVTAAHLTELFADLLRDVLVGKVTSDEAEDAICSPGGG